MRICSPIRFLLLTSTMVHFALEHSQLILYLVTLSLLCFHSGRKFGCPSAIPTRGYGSRSQSSPHSSISSASGLDDAEDPRNSECGQLNIDISKTASLPDSMTTRTSKKTICIVDQLSTYALIWIYGISPSSLPNSKAIFLLLTANMMSCFCQTTVFFNPRPARKCGRNLQLLLFVSVHGWSRVTRW